MGIVASTITEYYREEGKSEGRVEGKFEGVEEVRERVKLLMKQGFSELEAYRKAFEPQDPSPSIKNEMRLKQF